MRIISSKTHTYIGLVVGLVLIAAPWIFGFDDEDAPMWVAILVGLFVLINELTTTSPASPLKIVPMRIHLIVDVVTGVFLIVSPWLFQFDDLDESAWVPHIVVGALIAGYALLTDPADASRDSMPGTRTTP